MKMIRMAIGIKVIESNVALSKDNKVLFMFGFVHVLKWKILKYFGIIVKKCFNV